MGRPYPQRSEKPPRKRAAHQAMIRRASSGGKKPPDQRWHNRTPVRSRGSLRPGPSGGFPVRRLPPAPTYLSTGDRETIAVG